MAPTPPLAAARLPMAMPPVDAAATDDWAPTEIDCEARAVAPLVSSPPTARLSWPLAIVLLPKVVALELLAIEF